MAEDRGRGNANQAHVDVDDNEGIVETPMSTFSTFSADTPNPFFTNPSFKVRLGSHDLNDVESSVHPIPSLQTPVDSSQLLQPKHITPTSRPSLASQMWDRRPSFSSRKSSHARASSPTPSYASEMPSMNAQDPMIIPELRTDNLWDDIDGTSLSIDYFKATMRRFARSDKPEPQACLDFSMLHFINIRHLEHLLFAEVNWFREAIEKGPIVEDGNDKASHPEQHMSQAMKGIEGRYPERLKSIQKLLHQHSNAVRDFEDMRKRKVKTSIDLHLKPIEDSKQPRRPNKILGRYRNLSASLASSAPIDEEAGVPSAGQVSPIQSESGKALLNAVTVMKNVDKATNKLGRKFQLAQRRQRRQMRMRLSHREIAGVEDWDQDFKLQSFSHKAKHEEHQRLLVEKYWRDVRRFGMALAGGIALIVPVVIMSENQSLRWGLVTTSLATLVFAGGMTAFSKAEEKDILTATAAYAAVLVVFVGTTLPNPPKNEN